MTISIQSDAPCANHYDGCPRPARVRLFAPGADRPAPGAWCRPCAERTTAEYRDTLGEEWLIALAPIVCACGRVVAEDDDFCGGCGAPRDAVG